jgi:glycosyltransferase involved in cell wall biosynthesis
MLYFRAIRKVPGMTAKAIPLYLPPGKDTSGYGFDNKVFFGAISMFLREKVRLFRNMPAFMDKLFDTDLLLRLAATQAGTTRTEVDRLVKYLEHEGPPDVIHLSNALIIGLARQLKKRIDVKIVCSLLNEDDWIDEMAEPYRGRAWEMIARESQSIDHFVTPSNYYKEMFIRKTGIKGDNIAVVPLGFDHGPHEGSGNEHKPPALGYFCRISHPNGFDKLVDAFIEIKSGTALKDLTLHVCGGYTGDDKPFISSQIKKIRENKFEKSVRIYSEFQGNMKMEFFNNVDVISVPVRKYDGYGLYVLEANGAGIPVVQPDTGAFPEIIGTTGGGIIYSPDTTSELASSLLKVLTDDTLRKKLGETGRKRVRSELSLDRMAAGLSGVYGKLHVPDKT